MTGPDHRDLYLLVLGVIAGVLLGPAVLGRAAPDTYQRWFPSYEQAQEDLVIQQQQNLALQILMQGGVEMDSLDQLDQSSGDLDELRARRDRAARHRGRLAALIVAMLAVMIVEVLAAERPALRRRLTRGRYALAAVWIALVMAQPGAVRVGMLALAVLVFLVVLGAAWLTAARPPATDQSSRR